MAAGERGDGVVADEAARPRLKLGWFYSLAGTLFVPSKAFEASSSAPYLRQSRMTALSHAIPR